MNITEILKIKYPIIQGAMAHIAKSSLASAVSNAGGLGIIASGGMKKDELKEEIRKCKELTDKPFGVNLMLMANNLDELIEVILEEKPAVVTTGAGSPKKFMSKFKEAGIKVIPVVPSVKIAKKMEELGADAVICEGTEAGGHIGENATFPLVQYAVKELNIPVIAAGGIADGKGMAAMFLLGAKGVQIGTRFVLTNECDISDNYKELLKNSDETVVTGRTLGAPVRQVPNKMTDEMITLEKKFTNREEMEHLTLGSLRKAVKGDTINGSFMSGQIVSIVNDIKSVESVIESIMKEARETLDNAYKIELK